MYITEVEIIPKPRIKKLIVNEVLVEYEREVHKKFRTDFFVRIEKKWCSLYIDNSVKKGLHNRDSNVVENVYSK